MRITKKAFVMTAAMVLGAALFVASPEALAQAEQVQSGIDSIGGGDAPKLTNTVQDIVNLLLFLIGAVAVIMIIFGGFKYVTSAGESSAVSSAKNTILYAVVGLVVAISAYGIANFVEGIF